MITEEFYEQLRSQNGIKKIENYLPPEIVVDKVKKHLQIMTRLSDI